MNDRKQPIHTFIAAIFAFLVALPSSAPAAVEGKQPKLAIIFDGSGSMCGYFLPNDPARILQNLIKQAMILRNPSEGINVLSLRQKNDSKVSAQADLAPVAANFQAQAEVLSQLGKAGAGSCAPFDGRGSNLELIFDPQSGVLNSQAIVLVTDAQMKDKDRDTFLQGYDNWAMQTIKEGKVPYSGYVMAQSDFEGAYFSVAEPDRKIQASGYRLGLHKRPLALFWFAKGEEQLPAIATLATAFAKSKPVVQNLLPFVQSDALPLKIQHFSVALGLDQLLINSGQLTQAQLFDSDRSKKALLSCVKPSILDDRKTLSIQVKNACADTRPLWDGLTSLKYGVQLINQVPAVQYRMDGWDYNEKTHFHEMTIDRQLKEISFTITPMLRPEDSRTSLVNWSVDSDFCPHHKNAQGCLQLLNGKTYQLDVLSQHLARRSRPASQKLIEPIGTMTFQIQMDYKK